MLTDTIWTCGTICVTRWNSWRVAGRPQGVTRAKIAPAILESLLPDVWAKSHPASIRTFRTNEKQRRAETRRFKRAERRRTQAQG